MVFNTAWVGSTMSQSVGTGSVAGDVYQNLLKFDQLSISESRKPNWPRLPENGENIAQKKTPKPTANPTVQALLPTISSTQLTNRLALDCEMVGIGLDGKEHMVARVSVVNEHGDTLVDCYVKPQHAVKDYRTKISGVRPELIEHGVDFASIRELVRKTIYGRILVGHALKNDLLVLKLGHPKYNIRDTSRYHPIAKKIHAMGTPSLKSLTKVLLGKDIQNGTHDSVEDARAAMKIYLLFEKEWEKSARQSRKY